MKLNELAETLSTVLAQLTKAQTEIVGKIADLEAALGDTTLPPEAQAALAALIAQSQNLDDIVKDIEAPLPPEAPEIPDDPDAPTEPGTAI